MAEHYFRYGPAMTASPGDILCYPSSCVLVVDMRTTIDGKDIGIEMIVSDLFDGRELKLAFTNRDELPFRTSEIHTVRTSSYFDHRNHD